MARTAFDQVLGDRPNQLHRLREDVAVSARDVLDARVPGGTVSEAGLRGNISVAVQYLESWLRGVGAAAIYNLMEDAATAEISRSQVWQWVRHQVRLQEGPVITREWVLRFLDEEMERRSLR